VPAPERQTSRARQLRIHIWYPAAAASGTPLTMADYLGAGAATHRQDVARVLALTIGDADWARYTSQSMRALKEATPAAGPFPLLVGMARPVAVALGAEYLASHGYVVAYVERQAREPFAAEGLTLEGLVINEHQRDLQMTIARMRRDPNVDPARLGLIGLAADGLASLALAMRHPDVDAVALLESNWLQPTGASIYQQVAAFDPTALRAPLFFGYSEILGRNALEQVANIEAMRYASRHLLYFGEPRMTPLDFGTEGVVMAALLDQRREARVGVTRAFQTAHRYLRTFLDAYVKGDGAARSALDAVPGPHTSGALIELTSWPAVAPALSRTELRTLLDADLTKGLARARADLKSDPKAPVFDAAWLNSQGYDAAIRGLSDRAIAIYTLATEAAPRSANALDSLSDMLDRVGRKAEALAAAEKGLALLPADTTVTAADRKPLEDLLRARIARLK
jgi:tetratricopeptide (TPR) repeat protein